MYNSANRLAALKAQWEDVILAAVAGSHEICMEQSELNEEHVLQD